jgi:hypothetical protein
MRGIEMQTMIAPTVPISSASHDRYRKHPAVNITELHYIDVFLMYYNQKNV